MISMLAKTSIIHGPARNIVSRALRRETRFWPPHWSRHVLELGQMPLYHTENVNMVGGLWK